MMSLRAWQDAVAVRPIELTCVGGWGDTWDAASGEKQNFTCLEAMNPPG